MEKREIDKLKIEIINSYNFKTLRELYREYFKNWIDKGYIKSNLQKKDVYKKDEVELFNIMFQFYSDKDVLNACMKDMPKELKTVFKLICFGINVDISNLKETYKINVIDEKKKREYYYSEDHGNLLKKEFGFFELLLYRKYYYGEVKGALALPPKIRIIMTQNLEEKPLYYNLIPIKKIDSKYSKNFEIEILKNYLLYINIQNSGLIKKSASGKILKKSVVDFKNRANIEEMYEGNKKLEYFKSTLILEFIDLINFNKDEYSLDAKKGVKKLVTDIFENKLHYNDSSKKINLINLLLRHIKGIQYYYNENGLYDSFMKNIYMVFKDFKRDSWIEVTNIYDTALYKSENMLLIDTRLTSNHLYMMSESGAYYSGYKEKCYIDNVELYMNYIIVPFIKGVMVLLSFFGVFEIVYEEFEDKKGFEDENRNFLGSTEFDNIKHIKLTKLGEYVFGLRDDYEIESKEDVKIELDTKRLVINFNGEDNLKRVFIESIADKIGQNMYKVDFDSIFRNVLSAEDMKNNIQNFKNYIEKDLPENWKIFFENLEKRLNPIVETNEYRVFEIDKNKELIKLLTKDSYLKKYLLKAEDYKVLIKNKDMNRVKKKLKEHGFYLD